MLHEFGHWIGFDHTDVSDDFGTHCGDAFGIMRQTWNRLEQPDLSWGDECMFLKAYCCKRSEKIVESPTVPCPGCPPPNGSKPNMSGGMDGASENGFTVLPNPTSGMLTLRFTMPEESKDGSVRLVDAAGTIVHNQQLESATVHEIPLDVSGLPKGMYMVEVLAGGITFAKKVLIED
jgi:hypothetical protein